MTFHGKVRVLDACPGSGKTTKLWRHWCRQNGLKHLEGATEDDLV